MILLYCQVLVCLKQFPLSALAGNNPALTAERYNNKTRSINQSVVSLRMQRQILIDTASETEYNELFRTMLPVQTVYWCCPGNPPTISFRTDFNDFNYCFNLRSRRDIVKGRFQNGGVAYVFADELDLYGAAYKKDYDKLSSAENEILEVVRRDGPMNIKLIKEFTGLRSKDITLLDPDGNKILLL